MPQVDYTPKSWDQKRAESLKHAMGMFQIVDDRNDYNVNPDPQFDYLKRAEQYGYQAAQLRGQAAQQRAQNRNINLANSSFNMPPVRGSADFQAFIQAIAGKESGGNYGARNPDSGAMGKYQIMPANILGQNTGWDYDALGRDISPRQFMNRPRLQERIARAKLREYFQKYGAAGAASAWYSGNPNAYKYSNHAQGNYPSIAAYVQAILQAMGR